VFYFCIQVLETNYLLSPVYFDVQWVSRWKTKMNETEFWEKLWVNEASLLYLSFVMNVINISWPTFPDYQLHFFFSFSHFPF
jgi:hypothetical protein